MVYDSRYLDQNLLQVVDPVLERNAFFAHVENRLLCMIFDERKNIRKKALNYIKQARVNGFYNQKFEVPKINYNAEDYADMIDFTSVNITEPPLLSNFTFEELYEIAEEGKNYDTDIYYIPCHTQAVERGVKLVTEALARYTTD